MSSAHTARLRRRAGVGIAATLPLIAGALVLGSPANAAPSASGAPAGRDAVPGTHPAWAKPSAAQGATASTATVNARVYLAGRDPQGLTAYARSVSDPQSASYGKYLTAGQAQARFGASAEQQAAVSQWLKGQGLTVTAANRHYIAISGTAAATQKAFSTQLRNYRKSGHTYRAPATTASVPDSLNGAVLSVTGLDNAPHMAKHDDTLPGPGAAFVNSGPFSSYYGSNTAKNVPDAYGTSHPYVVKGYTGKQLRAAYGAGGLTGKGSRIAIVDAYASPTMRADSDQYIKNHGDKAWASGQYSEVLPSSYNSTTECGASGWYGEESLDVESSHSVAPDAKVTYVGASSCMDNDLVDALNTVVDRHLADIVSNSWSGGEAGETAADAAVYDQTFQMGAVEGIGFYFSTGDDGDELAATGTKQIGSPTNSAWATAVGGTSLAVGKGDHYMWETGWGTEKTTLAANGKSWTSLPGAFQSGAGGGTSVLIKQPFYQKGVVPNSIAKANGSTAMRAVPDISAVADPQTGFSVGQTQAFPDGTDKYSEYRIGGTSLSCPVIAGVEALRQQAQHRVIGFANPMIYSQYRTGGYHDVTDNPLGKTPIANVRVDFVNSVDASGGLVTSLRTFGHDSSLHATRGWDDVTGVGTPTARYYWAW
ncbi:serine protease [Mangrovactinospora gilvigrisea]|uniref:Serine protease n=1 Tax=Mangrovactinospora gilvigrisea TaxID=1428644 RepID=A0A1J7C9V6_9ACTN|nr:S53 family peptidase [Mangrovactinospora gilvigrisea]OIV38300.1 serine protease [Mangrovactinospora gilvigrisea]